MLLEKMREMKRKYRLLGRLYNVLCYFRLEQNNLLLSIGAIWRRLGFRDRRYEAIRSMKNRYEGERCFILCTGPSLTLQDIEKLSGEYTFGMNSTCLLYEKTAWRSSFYAIQDIGVYENVKSAIKSEREVTVFYSSFLGRHCRDVSPEWITFPYNGVYNAYDATVKNKFHAKFSDNAYSIIYDGFSITYSIFQIAVFMGFKEIFLLGADCNYVPGQKYHFIEHGYNPDGEYLERAKNRMFASYVEAKRYADAHGVRIYNATRGGMLEVFSRVDFDSLF